MSSYGEAIAAHRRSQALAAAIDEFVAARDDKIKDSKKLKWEGRTRWFLGWGEWDWIILDWDGTVYETRTPAHPEAHADR